LAKEGNGLKQKTIRLKLAIQPIPLLCYERHTNSNNKKLNLKQTQQN